jgi:hypothetical protein
MCLFSTGTKHLTEIPDLVSEYRVRVYLGVTFSSVRGQVVIVGIVKRTQARQTKNYYSIPPGERALTLLQSIQTGSGSHPASIAVGKGKLAV